MNTYRTQFPQKLFVGSCTNLDSTEELQLENLCSQRQNVSKRLEWCRNLQNWSLEQWKNVIFSDESSFTIFPTSAECTFGDSRKKHLIQTAFSQP